MRRLASAVFLSAIALVSLLPGIARAVLVAQRAPVSVWNGVYSDQQAQRGQQVYRRSCSKCHLADLSGGDDSGAAGEVPPPLAGPDFLERWTGRPLSELFLAMRRGMPLDAPGSLKPEAYADVLSYVLKVNGAPAGTADLSSSPEELEKITIGAKP
jgi:mono/diheme cytochrome c family protein